MMDYCDVVSHTAPNYGLTSQSVRVGTPHSQLRRRSTRIKKLDYGLKTVIGTLGGVIDGDHSG